MHCFGLRDLVCILSVCRPKFVFRKASWTRKVSHKINKCLDVKRLLICVLKTRSVQLNVVDYSDGYDSSFVAAVFHYVAILSP